MKVLFLTTFNIDVMHEHYFTKNVISSLLSIKRYGLSVQIASVKLDSRVIGHEVETEIINGVENHTLYVNSNMSHNDICDCLVELFKFLKPDVIHSQMIEGFDVLAAKKLAIPIVLTVHIGGFICPRNGGNGFLTYDDKICSQAISDKCSRCMLKDFPCNKMASIIYNCLKWSGLSKFIYILKKRIFYLSPISSIDYIINGRKNAVELFKYAHIIAANHMLDNLLKINGLSKKTHIIPHGVARRDRLPLKLTQNDPIKFFVLGRIQYSKGISDIFSAFKGIDSSRYELHIIGDAESSRHEQRYYKKILSESKGLNVTFHGRIPNNEIDNVISNCHIMIHAAFFLEVYGIAIAEALCMGRPVIATKCGGAEMQIRDGFNGWLIPPHDVQTLHATILDVINNPNSIIERSKNCELPHRLDAYVEELIGLYKNISDNN